MDETPKRKRGRPRKNPVEANPVAKKRRGRPPKDKTKANERDRKIKGSLAKRRMAAKEEKKDGKRKHGRPTDYREEYNDLAFKYCLLSAKDSELATFFDVDEATLNRWKIKYPTFRESLKEGREIADAYIGESLYQRAKGYSHPETKAFISDGKPVTVTVEKHHPPDPTSMIFWLKNRQKEKWRDKREVEAEVKVSDLSEEELNARLRSIMVKMTEDE